MGVLAEFFRHKDAPTEGEADSTESGRGALRTVAEVAQQLAPIDDSIADTLAAPADERVVPQFANDQTAALQVAVSTPVTPTAKRETEVPRDSGESRISSSLRATVLVGMRMPAVEHGTTLTPWILAPSRVGASASDMEQGIERAG